MSGKGGFKAKVQAWAVAHLGFIFRILRVIWPIVRIKDFALVTRFKDVQEVLSRDEAFMVTYEDNMRIVTAGKNFFLGMGPTPEYERDVSNFRIIMPRTDVESVMLPLIEKTAYEIVNNSGGTIDAVADLSRIVPAIFVEQYMGINMPTREELIQVATEMFYFLFFPNVSDEDKQSAEGAAERTRAHIDGLIAARKASGEQKDDALGRALALQKSGTQGLEDVDIRNNLLGIMIGAIPTTSKCAALVWDYLLDHPTQLVGAREAAVSKDWTTMNKYVMECLRFNPFSPGIFRMCIQDYKIARGTLRGRTIRKGTRVLAATQSAMLDGRELRRPGRFDVTRPDYQYMPFGYGMHTCFGQYLNQIQIPIIVAALVAQKDLRRAPGVAGKVQIEGEFPRHFQLEFTP